MTTQYERPSVFVTAFRDVTKQDPTPLAVAEAPRNPRIKHEIDEQIMAILEMRELEDDEMEF